MFSLDKFFNYIARDKYDSDNIAKNISPVILWVHQVILFYANGKLPKDYWQQNYICGFYVTLIDLFAEKIFNFKSKEEKLSVLMPKDKNLIVIRNVMEYLTPDDSTAHYFVYKFSDIIRNPNSFHDGENENFKNGSIHAIILFHTFEGLPLPPDLREMPVLAKARKISSNMDSKLLEAMEDVSEAGMTENQRISMALLEVLCKDYVKKFK